MKLIGNSRVSNKPGECCVRRNCFHFCIRKCCLLRSLWRQNFLRWTFEYCLVQLLLLLDTDAHCPYKLTMTMLYWITCGFTASFCWLCVVLKSCFYRMSGNSRIWQVFLVDQSTFFFLRSHRSQPTQKAWYLQVGFVCYLWSQFIHTRPVASALRVLLEVKSYLFCRRSVGGCESVWRWGRDWGELWMCGFFDESCLSLLQRSVLIAIRIWIIRKTSHNV